MYKSKKIIKISRPFFDQNEIKAATQVLKSDHLTQGPKTALFEKEVANYCGKKFAVSVSNGTAAIHTALYAIGIKKDDEVIVPSYTFIGTVNPILALGAKPVFVDILESDYCINPDTIENKITKKTKAIIPVDLFGQVYRYDKIKKITSKHNLLIVEDACQAFGAEQRSRKAGTFGDVGVFSFYISKNITTIEGGMLLTDNNEFAKKARQFRNHNQEENMEYEYIDVGFNLRSTDLSAAIGLSQFKKINKIISSRLHNSNIYLSGLRDINGLILPKVSKNNLHLFSPFCIRITKDFPITRDELRHILKENSIETRVYYPKPLHLYPQFKQFGYKKGDFPVSERLSSELLALPNHPYLTNNDLDYVISAIKSIC